MGRSHLEKIGHVLGRFKIENIAGNKGPRMAVALPPEGIWRLAVMRDKMNRSPAVEPHGPF